MCVLYVCVWGGRFCQDRLAEKTEEVLVQTRTRIIAARLGSRGQPVNSRREDKILLK